MKELRGLVASLDPSSFEKQIGPFALIQRPQGLGEPIKTKPMGTERTALVKYDDITRGALSLLFTFDELLVATLPPLADLDELSVGRLPDNDLVIDEPSVSKRHAVVQWDAKKKTCTLQDLTSTNGTFVNTSSIRDRPIVLKDADIISFGEAQFWYLLSSTLKKQLGRQSGSRKLRSRSG